MHDKGNNMKNVLCKIKSSEAQSKTVQGNPMRYIVALDCYLVVGRMVQSPDNS